MSQPVLLDAFCGAGGATRGYQLAGFRVVGVDITDQPRYCGEEFHRGDAIDFIRQHGHEFDAIHASPPCQAHTAVQTMWKRDHPNLIPATREALEATGLPWVIENVPGAPMRKDLVLCGSMFPELRDGDYGLIRHRWFEFSDPALAPVLVPSCNHAPVTVSVFGHGGHVYHGVEQWRRVMGIDWATRDEIAQAIPPAFTELVGRCFLQAVEARTEALFPDKSWKHSIACAWHEGQSCTCKEKAAA